MSKQKRLSILEVINQIEGNLTEQEHQQYNLTAEKIEAIMQKADEKIKRINSKDKRRPRILNKWYR